MSIRVLGMSLSGHGAAMCLVEDGRVARAVNLERITGKKFAAVGSRLFLDSVRERGNPLEIMFSGIIHEPSVALPMMLEYLTGERDPRAAGIDLVVAPHEVLFGQMTPDRQDVNQSVKAFFDGTRRNFKVEHHLMHAYQAFLPSPFDDAAVLTIDGRGDNVERHGGKAVTMSMGVAEGERVRILSEVTMPSSIGGVYGVVTLHLGFAMEQEGNTMALASFGSDRFYQQVKDTVQLHEDGKFRLMLADRGQNPDDDFMTAVVLLQRVHEFCPKRKRGEPLTDIHKDVAFAIQALTERVVVNAARALHAQTGKKRLVMAGGVALNCVTNALILNETPFEELYVVPNASDRGLALGAALYGYTVELGRNDRRPPGHDYLGKPYDDSAILKALKSATGIVYRRSEDIASECARLLAGGRIIGWVQGGAEFGPRALGHRSILADPRTVESKRRLDKEIKRREWFRPYAPSALAERADEFFQMRGPSPYMLQAVKVRPRAYIKVPGVVHTDGTARVQTVHKDQEPLYYELIRRFDELAGVPVVLNTSFNGYGKPMVETPEDAVRELPLMSLDALAMGNYIAWPEARDPFDGLDERLRTQGKQA